MLYISSVVNLLLGIRQHILATLVSVIKALHAFRLISLYGTQVGSFGCYGDKV